MPGKNKMGMPKPERKTTRSRKKRHPVPIVYGGASAGEGEEELYESDQRYSALFYRSPFAMALTRMPKGTTVDVNEAFLKLFEFTREEVIGKTSVELDISEPESQAQVRAELQKNGRVCNFEVTRRTKSGRRRDLSISIDCVSIGGAKHVLTTIQDITDRKKAEKALQESEERYRVLVAASSDVVYRMSPDWREMRYLLGKDFITDTEEPSQTWLQKYIHPDDQPHVMAVINNAIRTRSVFELEHRVLRVDGSLGWTFSRAIPILDANGEIIEWFGAASDITKRKQMEEELCRSRQELELRVEERTAELKKLNIELGKEIERRKKFESHLKNTGNKILREQIRRKFLSKKLVEILEKERENMASTLHDEVGQILTTIHMHLDFVKENARERPATILDEIEKIQERIRRSMEQIRDISRRLRPHVLDDLGLVPALRSLLQDIKETCAIGCHLYTKDIPETIAGESALAVYRIIQEAVTNCIRHARANNIFVNLTRRGQAILTTIEDDGLGFEYENKVEEIGTQRLGIMIMRERALQAGGQFRVESQVGKGTQVIAEIPMN
jgi:PAS domain S-box-containing protein